MEGHMTGGLHSVCSCCHDNPRASATLLKLQILKTVCMTYRDVSKAKDGEDNDI